MAFNVPPWDILPLNEYLVSLLPLEESLEQVPLLSKKAKEDVSEVLRVVAAVLPLLQQRQSLSLVSLRRNHVAKKSSNSRIVDYCLYTILFMDILPRLYAVLPQEMKLALPSDPTTNTISAPETQIRSPGTSTLQECAAERRRKLWRYIQSVWPLLKLALWLRLTRAGMGLNKKGEGMTSNNLSSDKLPTLFVLYAHRRWLHQVIMDLKPALVDPLLLSWTETRTWLKSLIQDVLERRRHYTIR